MPTPFDYLGQPSCPVLVVRGAGRVEGGGGGGGVGGVGRGGSGGGGEGRKRVGMGQDLSAWRLVNLRTYFVLHLI